MPILTRLILLLVFCSICGACAQKKSPPAPQSPEISAGMPRDLHDFPQNLEVYAREAGADKRLITTQSQNEMDASFNRIYFGPWQMTRTSVGRRNVASLLRNARGYKNGSVAWHQADYEAMSRNAALKSFPSRATHAITLRDTDLREIPTHEPRYSKPTPNVRDNPFDLIQYSLLPIGTPLFVAHTTQDGRWHYVECPVAGGWVDANDVAFVDGNFTRLWHSGKYAALVRDNITLPGTGVNGTDSKSGIGAILPCASKNADGSLNLIVPTRGSNGFADTAEIQISAQDAAIKPLPLTPGNVARVGNVMMGMSYGWGGMLGLRDCSALTRDIFVPFGIWLPRNSAPQSRRGSVIPLSRLSAQEKTNVILRDGVPFLSLLGMKGHITLYVGKWQGKPAIFHNVWGLRAVKNGSDNERIVIGKAVVTSITPGIEMKELYRPVTFVDRLRTLTQVAR